MNETANENMNVAHTRIRIGACGEVEVWSVASYACAPHVDRLHGLLCERERRRATEYRHAPSRATFVVSRAMLRLALSEYTHVEPHAIRLGEGKNGKPELRCPADSSVQFSLAHADGLTLIALTRGCRVGIDVERLRRVPEAEQIMARFASPSERAAWRQLPFEQRQRAFFRWWTRKEAYLKATGEGLSGSLGAFDVSLSEGDAPQEPAIGGLGITAVQWSLVELVPEPGYLATLAVEQVMPTPPVAVLRSL